MSYVRKLPLGFQFEGWEQYEMRVQSRFGTRETVHRSYKTYFAWRWHCKDKSFSFQGKGDRGVIDSLYYDAVFAQQEYLATHSTLPAMHVIGDRARPRWDPRVGKGREAWGAEFEAHPEKF